MSVKQIKSYINIRTFDQLTRVDNATNEQIVKAYQCTDELAGLTEWIINTARNGKATIISGPRGIGKSHLLALIRALIDEPAMAARIHNPAARMALEKVFSNITRPTQLIAFDPEKGDLNTALSHADELIKETRQRGSCALFIDGISALLRTPDQGAAKNWLNRVINGAQTDWIFITLDQDLLEGANAILEDKQKCQPVVIPEQTFQTIVDKFIFQKDYKQRAELEKVYDELRQEMPHFQWSREEFIACYPLHPRVLKLAPALRRYGRSFSLFGFLYTVAPRAVMRRGTSLINVTELFESFEFDLRRNEILNDLFTTYDHLVGNFIRSLPESQQFYGKMLLRAITILSLSREYYTALEIADSVMLYDDTPHVLFRQQLKSVMDFMAAAAGDRMNVETDRPDTRYALVLDSASIKKDPIEEAIENILDDDRRLVEALVDCGALYFKEWPLGYERFSYNFRRRVEAELLWRGTARRGLVKLGGPMDITEKEDLAKNEWQLTLLSPFADELPAGRPNKMIRYWYPAKMSAEDIGYLKRLIVLREQGEEYLDPVELKAERDFLIQQSLRIFTRCYIEQGRLGGPDRQEPLPTKDRKFSRVLGLIFDRAFEMQYPAHPDFGDLLNEKVLKVLARGFFYRSEWHKAELNKYLQQFALPLHIVTLVKDRLEYSLNADIPEDSPLGRLLQMLANTGVEGISRAQAEERLRSRPFGLQQPVLLLLVLGAAAAGHIILTDAEGEIILTSAGVRSGCDVVNYARICLPAAQLQKRPTGKYPGMAAEPKEAVFAQPLEEVFQEIVNEALKPTHSGELTPPSEDILLEFYQTSGITPLSRDDVEKARQLLALNQVEERAPIPEQPPEPAKPPEIDFSENELLSSVLENPQPVPPQLEENRNGETKPLFNFNTTSETKPLVSDSQPLAELVADVAAEVMNSPPEPEAVDSGSEPMPDTMIDTLLDTMPDPTTGSLKKYADESGQFVEEPIAVPETPKPNSAETLFDDIEIEPITGSLPALPEILEESLAVESRRAEVYQPPIPSSAPPPPELPTTVNSKIEPAQQEPDIVLITARKLTNERNVNREIPLIYEQFLDVCKNYPGPQPQPSLDQFKNVVLDCARKLGDRSHSREIWCHIEIINGTVQVHCQAGRASLFQKRPPRERVL